MTVVYLMGEKSVLVIWLECHLNDIMRQGRETNNAHLLSWK